MTLNEFVQQFLPRRAQALYAPPEFYEHLGRGYLNSNTVWYLPNPGDRVPRGTVDLMSMSEEEIDAYWDEQERQITAIEGQNNEN